jgi:putative transposase
MADLGVTKTHRRPHVSDDNPYSESHFRTLKYMPGFPERFSLQNARDCSPEFFAWYNEEHRHSGLGLLSPAVVHYRLAPAAIGAEVSNAALKYGTSDSTMETSARAILKMCGQPINHE